MAGSKKRKVGGVKKSARRDPSSRTPRSVGGVKQRPGAPSRSNRVWERSCCPGTEVGGHWYHQPGCREAAVGWLWAGWTPEDWNCPWGCKPITFASSLAHPWDCGFWMQTEETPF